MIFNVSTGKKYATQRDNDIRASETCCPTSLAMALIYSGRTLPAYTGQLEDTLTRFTNTNPDVLAFYKNHPEKWVRDEFVAKRPANEIHPVMAYAINKWMGDEVVNFAWSVSPQTIFASIMGGKACVLSGKFEYKNLAGEIKSIGHVVCCVGFETTQEEITEETLDIKLVKNVIIDDPYGDYRTLYLNHDGNDVVMPYSDFINKIKEQKSAGKWCYLFK